MTIGIAGLTHLGMVMASAAAEKGFDVLTYDPDEERCDLVSAVHQGLLAVHQVRAKIAEPGLAEQINANRERLRAAHDPAALRECDLIVCSADVPTDDKDQSNLKVIRSLLDTVVHHAAPGTTLVIMSQVPPGFTRTFANGLDKKQQLQIFYQVETLVFGSAVARARNPERFIIGCAIPTAPRPAPYERWLGAFGCQGDELHPMSYESAEFAKIAINMFLASSVKVVNTLMALCERIGADWSEIVPALTSDRRIGPHAYVQPGLGIGGGNIPRDDATMSALIDRHGMYVRNWVLHMLHAEVLSRRPDPVIAIWGLAYKPGTNSTKHSPAMDLLEVLGSPTAQITVQAYDPHVRLNGHHPRQLQAASALDACRGADALAIMTPWPEFAAVPLAQVREMLRGSVIVDPFGVLFARRCTEVGLRHLRRGAPVPQEVC